MNGLAFDISIIENIVGGSLLIAVLAVCFMLVNLFKQVIVASNEANKKAESSNAILLRTLQALEGDHAQRNDTIDNLRHEVDNCNKKIKTLEDLAVERAEQIKTLEKQIQERDKKITELQEKISKLEKSEKEKDDLIKELRKELEQVKTEREETKKERDQLQEQFNQLKKQIDEKEKQTNEKTS